MIIHFLILLPSGETIDLLWLYSHRMPISWVSITSIPPSPLTRCFHLAISRTLNPFVPWSLIQAGGTAQLTCPSCKCRRLWLNILFFHLLQTFVLAADHVQENLLMFQKRTAAPQITLNLLAPGIIWVQWSVCILGQGSFLTANRVINLLFTRSIYKLSNGDCFDITRHFFLVIIFLDGPSVYTHRLVSLTTAFILFPHELCLLLATCTYGTTCTSWGCGHTKLGTLAPLCHILLLGFCYSNLSEVFHHPYWTISLVIMPSISLGSQCT